MVDSAKEVSNFSIEQLRLMHDNELVKLNCSGNKLSATDHAKVLSVLENRQKAASFIRLIAARVCAHPRAMSSPSWAIQPCIMDTGNLGFLHYCDGVAFDSTVACTPECDDLGYLDPNVLITGSEPLRNSKVFSTSPTKIPNGWRQICLPTWRGYEGDGHCLVPEELYKNKLLEPRLVCFGLTNCYGEPGLPRKTLFDWVNSSAEPPHWITAGFERPDPSWWPWKEESRERVARIVDDWFLECAKILARGLEDSEKCLECIEEKNFDKLVSTANRTSYASDYWSLSRFDRDLEDIRIESVRGRVADAFGRYWISKVLLANTTMQKFGYQCFEFLVKESSRRRLKESMESLRWMVNGLSQASLINISREDHPKVFYYNQAVVSAAESIVSYFCEPFFHEARKLLNETLVSILYEDGPVYVDRNLKRIV